MVQFPLRISLFCNELIQVRKQELSDQASILNFIQQFKKIQLLTWTK